ncbi:hypothetical protein H8R18_06920 [Nanchangia anserum]|uniref:DUF2241 domain-containing protein n=1 Tax=Nanchangia anserum TaxID=2692125 RepID=A0A8I0GE97_9ACTO|nr:ACT domain-containing protein [Nanchangia anserum]MBD3689262.1 hypothetical protein [Nanchangia anserum]QOX81483.1 hypothetical protein H8R18_06920 [Nanchangia anserum]
MENIVDFDSALARLEPAVRGTYVYCDAEGLSADIVPFAVIAEAEGTCALIPLEQAREHDVAYSHEPLSRISLGINLSVKLQGLTGTVAQNLAAAQIPCNVISGMRHDHLFVPKHRAHDAMATLDRLSRQARGWAQS